jgi:hypothetical protein
MDKLEKELEILEAKHGKGEFVIDEEHQVIKRKGYKCLAGFDIPKLAFDTVAEHIAEAEGKDYTKSTVKNAMAKRMKVKDVS